MVLFKDAATKHPIPISILQLKFSKKSAAIPQKKDPIEALNIYMNRFHFHSKQMKAHHYCSIISKEFYQCSIYNGNNRNSKLIGVEYIVSHRIFESFDSN